MSLEYALIAKGALILAEYTDRLGNFQTITRLLLPKIPQDCTRISYLYDEHTFHYYKKNEFSFLTMCPKGADLRLPYLYLNDIANQFFATIPAHLRNTTIALSLDQRLSPMLKERMVYWNEYFLTPHADMLRHISSQVANIQDVMVDNIDKILARKEKIDLLVNRTEELHQDAVQFTRQTSRFYRRVWWRQKKLLVAGASTCMAIFLLISMIECGGPSFPSCHL